jgi:phosphoglycolate phosphatase
MMLEMLKVEITHTKSLPPNTDLLITVDCQHGAGNVQAFPLSDSVRVMTIDHHKPETPEMMTNGENVIIRSELASCSTLVWDLLRKERYEMEAPVVNALYYGLYTDTNGLSELRHPLDRDLAEQPYDVGFIRVLKNASISMEELDIMARSLQKREMIGEIGLFCADRCDANLLGFASDIAQQVVGVNACVVYCVQEHGVKLSVRACTREIMASELADFICREAGSGGGAAEKAGGYMSLAALAEKATPPGEYVRERIREYARHYELIYAADNAIDFAGMKPYKKQATPVAYMSIADVFPVGTKITVRTQSGDSDGIVDRNTVLMISADSSLYPITRQRFEAGYDVLGNAFYPAAGYTPVIVNRHTQERHSVFAYARTCIPKDEKPIRAIQLTRAVKLFSRWDTDRYTTGEQGDWLTATDGDYDNCVLVKAEEFAEMYIPC